MWQRACSLTGSDLLYCYITDLEVYVHEPYTCRFNLLPRVNGDTHGIDFTPRRSDISLVCLRYTRCHDGIHHYSNSWICIITFRIQSMYVDLNITYVSCAYANAVSPTAWFLQVDRQFSALIHGCSTRLIKFYTFRSYLSKSILSLMATYNKHQGNRLFTDSVDAV